MRDRRSYRLSSLLIAALTIAACGGGAATQSSGQPASLQPTPAQSSNQIATYKNDAALLEAAKKEGTVTIYQSSGFHKAMKAAFEAAYPWATLNTVGGTAPAVAAQLQTEATAGVHNADVVNVSQSLVPGLVKSRAVVPVHLENDSLTPANLRDPEFYGHPVQLVVLTLCYNTNLVKAGPASLEELAQPAWRDKLAFDKPSSGITSAWLFASARKKMGDTAWRQWLAGIKSNNAFLTSDGSSTYAAVLRGERAVGICGYSDVTSQAAGAPVAGSFYGGSNVVTTLSQAALAAQAPHPAMAGLLLNWLLSPSGGQQVIGKDLQRIPATPNVAGAPTLPSGVALANPYDTLGDYFKTPESYLSVYKEYWP